MNVLGKLIISKPSRCSTISWSQRRTFYRMLNAVFNRPDKNRIQEVGADRACAEWLLRCGAKVRWKDAEGWQTDYNSLPPAQLRKLVIEEVDADEAAVMEIGFQHFDGCKFVKKVRFYYCPYLEDTAVEELARLRESLEHLEIGSCGDVTERGLATLAQLSHLKTLNLYDLPAVRNKQQTFDALKKSLADCDVVYKDLQKDS